MSYYSEALPPLGQLTCMIIKQLIIEFNINIGYQLDVIMMEGLEIPLAAYEGLGLSSGGSSLTDRLGGKFLAGYFASSGFTCSFFFTLTVVLFWMDKTLLSCNWRFRCIFLQFLSRIRVCQCSMQ